MEVVQMNRNRLLIRAAEDAGFYIRCASVVDGEVKLGIIVFAGDLDACLAYLRKKLEEPE
jgi:hypothetical protein